MIKWKREKERGKRSGLSCILGTFGWTIGCHSKSIYDSSIINIIVDDFIFGLIGSISL
jgi:hypothetical protein